MAARRGRIQGWEEETRREARGQAPAQENRACMVGAHPMPPRTDCLPPFLPPIWPIPDMPPLGLSCTTYELGRSCCGCGLGTLH